MPELLSWQQQQWDRLLRTRREGRLPHALLLAGPAGTGKQSFARLLAQALVCHEPDQALGLPCGRCAACHQAERGVNSDIISILPEEPGKQIKVDAVRELISDSVLAVALNRHRLFIIDPADAMGVAASNALLKTLEEPIPRSLLILVSSKPGALPATIRSRCQTIDFSMPEKTAARAWLMKQIGATADEADALLGMSGGAPFAALAAHQAGRMQPYLQVLAEFLALPAGKSNPVQIAANWLKLIEWPMLLGYLAAWVEDMLRARSVGQHLRVIPQTYAKSLNVLENRLDLKALFQFLDQLDEHKRALVNNLNAELALEHLLWLWIGLHHGEHQWH